MTRYQKPAGRKRPVQAWPPPYRIEGGFRVRVGVHAAIGSGFLEQAFPLPRLLGSRVSVAHEHETQARFLEYPYVSKDLIVGGLDPLRTQQLGPWKPRVCFCIHPGPSHFRTAQRLAWL